MQKKNVWSVDEAWDRNVHTVRWESALTAKVQAQYRVGLVVWQWVGLT